MTNNVSQTTKETRKTGPITHTQRFVFGQWVVLITSVITFALAVGIPISLSVMLLDIKDTFQVTRVQAAAVHSTCIGIMFAGAIIPGYIMTRVGARSTLLSGSIIATIGFLLSMFATSTEYLIGTTGVIAGVGCCFLLLPIIPVITTVPTSYKSVTISISYVAAAVFGIVNRLIVVHISNMYSFRIAYAYLAALSLHTCLGGIIITSVFKSKHSCESLISESDSFEGNIIVKCKKTTKETKEDKLETDEDESLNNEEEKQTEECEGEGQKEGKEMFQLKGKDGNIDDDDDGYELEGTDQQQQKELIQLVNNHKENGNDLYKRTDGLDESQTALSLSNDFNNQTTAVATKSIEALAYIIPNHIETKSKPQKVSKLPIKWRFLVDFIFILHTIHCVMLVATLYSFALIQTDFARTLGVDDATGVIYLNAVFIASIVGRVGVGLLDLFPRVHNVVGNVVFSAIGSIGIVFLSFVTNHIPVMVMLCLVGISLGGIISIYPKCIMDMNYIDEKSYPLALGLTFTLEGFMDLIIPLAIGASVDATGSYTLILIFLGGSCAATTLALGFGFWFTNRQNLAKTKTGKRTGNWTI